MRHVLSHDFKLVIEHKDPNLMVYQLLTLLTYPLNKNPGSCSFKVTMKISLDGLLTEVVEQTIHKTHWNALVDLNIVECFLKSLFYSESEIPIILQEGLFVPLTKVVTLESTQTRL